MSATETPSTSGRRHPLAICEECDLNDSSSRFVPTEGNASNGIAIVGEAPGYQEAVEGRPFTGPSGKLLDLVLDHYGVSREACLVTNVCLCRPPSNATPSKRSVRACAPRLKAELDAVDPDYIIGLGGTAASALMGYPVKVTVERAGPPKQSSLYPSSRIIPTVHPAYCLRTADAFPLLTADIGKVHFHASVAWEPPTYRTFDRPDEARRALSELRNRGGPLTVDIEVGFEKDSDFEHPDQYQLLCVGFGYEPGKVAVVGESALGDVGVRRDVGRLLQARSVTAHNGKFDLAGLASLGVGTLEFDTMLASYADNEMPGTHGLKYLATEILGAPQYDLELKRYISKGESFAHVPRELLYQYNAFDCSCTYDLRTHYEANLSPELLGLHDFLVRASNALMPLEMEGIGVDTEYLDYLTTDYLKDLDKLERALAEIVGFPGFNPRSPKQVKEFLADASINVASTNEETLRMLIDQGRAVEFCEQMLRHRREQKLYGTYVKGIRARLYQSGVYPTFLLHGTVSGRLACRNPNMQNVPRESKIRKLFIPRAGNTFVQGDYAQAELRVMATLSQDVYLKGIFDEGRDLHSEVAERFFGPGFTKEQRVRAKAVVFGLAYGREAFSLASEFDIPVSEAQRYLNTFFEAIPQLVDWRTEVQAQVVQEHEDLVTPFGRHRRFWLITNENKKDIMKEALSFKPQSIASDINLSALIKLQATADSDVRMRLPVHDSLLAECPTEKAPEVAKWMKETMEETATEVFSDYVRFPVDVATGPSWGELN